MGILHLLSVVGVRDSIHNHVGSHDTGLGGCSRGRNDRRRAALANLQYVQILGADLPKGRGLEESAVSIQQMVFGKV
jgi:hypothetical protein